jgi:hypothetical protein
MQLTFREEFWIKFWMYRVLHKKRNPNYSSICKLWRHQYIKANELSFSVHLSGRTYKTASQQMLKMSTTIKKAIIQNV